MYLTVDYMDLDLVWLFLLCIVDKTGFPLVYLFRAHPSYPSVGFFLYFSFCILSPPVALSIFMNVFFLFDNLL